MEVEVTSQGETLEQARANLAEALALYFEDEPGHLSVGEAPIIVPLDVGVPSANGPPACRLHPGLPASQPTPLGDQTVFSCPKTVAGCCADKLTPCRTAARHSSVAARRTAFAQAPRAPDVRSPRSRTAGHSGKAVTRSEDGSRARRGGGRRILPPCPDTRDSGNMVVPAAMPSSSLGLARLAGWSTRDSMSDDQVRTSTVAAYPRQRWRTSPKRTFSQGSLVIILSAPHQAPCAAERPRQGTSSLHKGRLTRYYGVLEGPGVHERLRQKRPDS